MSTPLPAGPAPVAPQSRFWSSGFGRFLHRLWNGVNFLRRLVLNILFLIVLLLFVIFLFVMSGSEINLQKDSALILNPEGKIVEQFTEDPFFASLMSVSGRSGEVRLRDMLQVLRKAKTDDRINRVVLDLDKLQLSGWASTREIASAIREVRAAGKPVIAFTEGTDQGTYLLNAASGAVYLDPMNGITLQGLGRYRTYYRELLQDKLGIDLQLFKVGTYKSAAETYVLDQASAAAKEADLFWMSDVWNRYLAEVAKDRKLDTAAFSASINNIREGVVATQGDLAQYALQNKWVDGLKTRQQFNDMIAERAVKDKDNSVGYRAIGYSDYLQLASLEPDKTQPLIADKRVGIVVAEGNIVSGSEPPGVIGGESTAALLRDARKDKAIKAVVLRVNSPGGEVFPSEQIRREVELLKAAGKPVVVSMGDVAASGGYWISMNANRIYADPSTITGSIGIYGLIPNFTRALNKVGVHSDGVGTTPVAGAFDVARPMDPGMAALIQSVIEKGYRDFIGGVGKARGKSLSDVDTVAQGRVWTGAQARERGLVDEFGTLRNAVEHAASLAKLGKVGDFGTVYLEESRQPFSAIFSKIPRVAVLFERSSLLQSLLRVAAPQVADDLRFVERVATGHKSGTPVVGVAHCFCEAY